MSSPLLGAASEHARWEIFAILAARGWSIGIQPTADAFEATASRGDQSRTRNAETLDELALSLAEACSERLRTRSG